MVMTLVSSLRKNIFAVVGGSKSIQWASRSVDGTSEKGVDVGAEWTSRSFECGALCSRSNNQGRRTVLAFPRKQWAAERSDRGRGRQLLAHDLRARRNLEGITASNERQWFLEAV